MKATNKSSRKSVLKAIAEVNDEMAEYKPVKQGTLSHKHSEKREALLKREDARMLQVMKEVRIEKVKN